MANQKRIIGYNLIGEACEVKGCLKTADSIFRHAATGAVVSARCKVHDTMTRRSAINRGDCPKCHLPRDWHHDEDENTYTCDRAENYAADMAERNLPA